MKLHEFTVYGGQTEREDGGADWPDYISLKLPKAIQLDIIIFLANSLKDENMEEATINMVGEIKGTGEKTAQELFGPTTQVSDDSGNTPE